MVVAIGEDAFQSGEGRSQADIGFKGLQEELLKAVFAANKKVVVVLMSGRPMTLGWTGENVPAILEAWFGGSQAGHAIADVLFGDTSPSGRLPVAFPRHVGQLPMTYAHKNTGRPGPGPRRHVVGLHRHAERPAVPVRLRPELHELHVLRAEGERPRDRPRRLGAGLGHVTNTGKRAGVEVAQLYVRDLVGSVTRPVKELKGIQKVDLSPGQSREVTFTLHGRRPCVLHGVRQVGSGAGSVQGVRGRQLA